MALRASTMTRRTGQDLRSPQSSQGRNAVTEAHGIRRERTIEGAHDRADADLMGRARERVSAALAFLGVNEAGVPELGQNMVEELFRNRIGFGYPRDLSQLARRQASEMHHGLQAILPLLRKHKSYPSLRARSLFGRWRSARSASSSLVQQFLDGEHTGRLRKTRRPDCPGRIMTDLAPKMGGWVEFYRSPARRLWTPTGINAPEYGKPAQEKPSTTPNS